MIQRKGAGTLPDEDTDLLLFGSSSPEASTKLEIVNARFDSHSRSSFEDLISGYSSMRVLTYSNSISMVRRAANLLDDMEVIFGREDIVRGMSTYLTLQQEIVKGLRAEVRGKDLLEQGISTGSLRFYVLKDAISHEKMFLLEGERGTRVITGSANFSETAFSGNQNESYVCFDDDHEAWKYFNTRYEKIKAQSAMSISEKAILARIFNDEDLPILSEDGSAQKIVEVREGAPSLSVVHKMISQKPSKKFEGINQVVPARNGTTRWDRRTRSQTVSYLKSKVLPEDEDHQYLDVDSEAGRISVSGEDLNLTPPEDDVKCDTRLMLEYFQGYEHFKGNTGKLARDYFTFMCWLYAGPLVCEFRNAAQARGESGLDHPIFGILYGKSSCGKSALVKTLLISMFGQEGFLPHEWFTGTRVKGLWEQNRRYPLAFDDLPSTRFSNHAFSLIKEDRIPLNDYPVTILSMNTAQDTFESEIRKRALIFYADASLPDNTGEHRDLDKQINRIRQDLGDALFREYMRRSMIGLKEGPPADPLEFSSTILKDIFTENSTQALPAWCRITSMDEYSMTKHDKVKDELLQRMRYSPDAWSRNRDRIVLRLDDIHDLRKLKKDVPDYLIGSGSGGNTLVLDARLLKEFLGELPFEKNGLSGLFARLFASRR